jgi:hypothetical protein
MPSSRMTKHLRELADVARILAKEATTPKSRRAMTKLAADYEAWARRIEAMDITQPKGEISN